MVKSASGRDARTLFSNQTLLNGFDISLKTNRIYWTNMGVPTSNDGTVQSCSLDESDVQSVIKPEDVHTPKQTIIDHQNEKLYFCDREGLRAMRCGLGGQDHKLLVQRGDWKVESETSDRTRRCVGIAEDAKDLQFYWTRKGPSKGGKGRIFRANMQMPGGENAVTRSDIETVLMDLPEPMDLEIELESKMPF